ncbi:CvpA family protein [Geobacter sp. DSM 9736]|uniref:CvpA family protein n=1 Tax=Geobacter sp. DSM 9736 TaxID=1277350 RepID=UPI000B50B798|nr:CvpA family protein [Geobacter sp. DSM 9736]SNB47798.1 membrane protein required for colicin V production [Geobacter sp. DSM 9736]
MSLVDILIWAVLLLFVVKGFMKGLVREVCSLLGLLAGGWASFRYYHYLAELLRPFIHLPHSVARALSFIAIFLVIGLLFYLFGHLLTIIFRIMLLGGINRIGGVFFGLLEGAFILCMVLYFGTADPVPERIRKAILKSKTALSFIRAGREMIAGWDSADARNRLSN